MRRTDATNIFLDGGFDRSAAQIKKVDKYKKHLSADFFFGFFLLLNINRQKGKYRKIEQAQIHQSKQVTSEMETATASALRRSSCAFSAERRSYSVRIKFQRNLWIWCRTDRNFGGQNRLEAFHQLGLLQTIVVLHICRFTQRELTHTKSTGEGFFQKCGYIGFFQKCG